MRKPLALLVLGLFPVAHGLLACEGDSSGSSSGQFTVDSGAFEAGPNGGNEGGGGDGGGDGSSEAGPPTTFTTFQIALAGAAACGVLPDGTMKCWGSALVKNGVSGAGDAPGEMGAALPTVTLPQRVRKVAAALSGSGGTFCIILEDGGLRCWGGGPTGQAVGSFYLEDVKANVDLGAGRTAKDVVIGSEHACAILDDGHVKCWGDNPQGTLGIGTTVNSPLPPADPIDLGTGRTAKALTARNGWTCALLDDDRVKCWGGGNNTVTDVGDGGWLGNGSTAHVGDQPGEMGDALAYAKLGTDPDTGAPWKVKKILGGGTFACAILANDRVKCWGQPSGGALGSEGNTPTGVSIVDDGIPFVDVGKDPMTGKPWSVTDLTAQDFAVCVTIAKNGGTVRCWGADNGFGALGRGDAANIGSTPGTMGDNLVDVALKPGRKAGPLTSNYGATCTLVAAGIANCWGHSGGGDLGTGTPNANIGDDPSELGAGLAETFLQ